MFPTARLAERRRFGWLWLALAEEPNALVTVVVTEVASMHGIMSTVNCCASLCVPDCRFGCYHPAYGKHDPTIAVCIVWTVGPRYIQEGYHKTAHHRYMDTLSCQIDAQYTTDASLVGESFGSPWTCWYSIPLELSQMFVNISESSAV